MRLAAAIRAAAAAIAAIAAIDAIPASSAALLALGAAAPLWAVPPAAGSHSATGSARPVRHLGRLFATPEQRAQLDAQRDGNAVESAASPDGAAMPVATPAAPLQLNGVLQRQGGRSTVWLNTAGHNDGGHSDAGRTQAALPEADSVVQPDRSVRLRLPSGKHITLKAGQQYDETTGSISNVGQ